MKIKPLKNPRWRPPALLEAGRRTLTVRTSEGEHTYHGRRSVETALEGLSGHVCYSLAHISELRHSTGALSWTCGLWRGRETRMVHGPSGVVVTSLQHTLDASEDPFSDLCRVLEWLRGYGVPPGSVASMAWNLWRSTLDREMVIGFDPEVGQESLYGGRQEIQAPGVYRDMLSFDIKAAYPVAMASRPYALSLRPVSLSTMIDPEASGLCHALVMIPDDLPYSPLPVRVMDGVISFQKGKISGIWPWAELAAAIELGAEVRPIRMWAPKREADLFGRWWPVVAEGRALGGSAATLAKGIANATWGQFSMVGDSKATRSWIDDAGVRSYETPEEPRGLPHHWTAHIAGETTSRVRVRVLTEGLYGGSVAPVHVDTDGIIVSGDYVPPAGISGDEPGQWRIKASMAEVDIRAAQLYRWRYSEGSDYSPEEFHYCAAGIPAEDAPAFFAKRSGPIIDLDMRRAEMSPHEARELVRLQMVGEKIRRLETM